jgi:hypothetical protein
VSKSGASLAESALGLSVGTHGGGDLEDPGNSPLPMASAIAKNRCTVLSLGASSVAVKQLPDRGEEVIGQFECGIERREAMVARGRRG